MSFVILIPARSGSKRIKDKNLKLFNNFPLIYWTIKEAKKTKIKDIYLSTDSKKIMEFGLSQGIKAPFLRPNSISDDKAKMIDVIKHFCDNLGKTKNFKNIILLQPTSPLRNFEDINAAIDLFLSSNSDSLVSAYRSNELKELKKASFWLKQQVYRGTDLLIDGNVRLAALDKLSKKLVPLPKDIHDCLEDLKKIGERFFGRRKFIDHIFNYKYVQ